MNISEHKNEQGITDYDSKFKQFFDKLINFCVSFSC